MSVYEAYKGNGTGLPKKSKEYTIDVITKEVWRTANSIEKTNANIDKNYEKVDHAMHNLFNNWNSPAQEVAKKRYNTIKRTYHDGSRSRYKIIQNYVETLRTAADTYEVVEDKNTKMKEAYKMAEE